MIYLRCDISWRMWYITFGDVAIVGECLRALPDTGGNGTTAPTKHIPSRHPERSRRISQLKHLVEIPRQARNDGFWGMMLFLMKWKQFDCFQSPRHYVAHLPFWSTVQIYNLANSAHGKTSQEHRKVRLVDVDGYKGRLTSVTKSLPCEMEGDCVSGGGIE